MKRKRGIKINLSNRWLYILIVIGIIAAVVLILSVGVYADTVAYTKITKNTVIERYNDCYSNNCGMDILAPTKTDKEWNSFVSKHPSCISTYGCPPQSEDNGESPTLPDTPPNYYVPDVPCSGCSEPGDGGGKVICTELYENGDISYEWYEADVMFAEKYIDEETFLGYHSWAKPVVRIMKRSDEVREIITPIAKEWAKHVAYEAGYSDEDSAVGKVILEEGVIFSKKLGKNLKEEGYIKYEFDEDRVESLILKYLKKYQNKSLNKEEIPHIREDMRNLFFELESEFRS